MKLSYKLDVPTQKRLIGIVQEEFEKFIPNRVQYRFCYCKHYFIHYLKRDKRLSRCWMKVFNFVRNLKNYNQNRFKYRERILRRACNLYHKAIHIHNYHVSNIFLIFVSTAEIKNSKLLVI